MEKGNAGEHGDGRDGDEVEPEEGVRGAGPPR